MAWLSKSINLVTVITGAGDIYHRETSVCEVLSQSGHLNLSSFV